MCRCEEFARILGRCSVALKDELRVPPNIGADREVRRQDRIRELLEEIDRVAGPGEGTPNS